MSLLDTVEPDGWLITATDRNGEVLIRTCFLREEDARGLMQAAIDKGGYDASNVSIETMSSRPKVESLLDECRKQVLLDAADIADNGVVQGNHGNDVMTRHNIGAELRRMAESDKTTMEGDK